MPVGVLAQTILGSNPQFAPDMANDVEQVILDSREHGRGEQLAAALEAQILQVNNFGGMQTMVYLRPLPPLADLLVQSASDRSRLADFLETRLKAAREQGKAVGRFGGMALSEDQEVFQSELIKRLREAL